MMFFAVIGGATIFFVATKLIRGPGDPPVAINGRRGFDSRLRHHRNQRVRGDAPRGCPRLDDGWRSIELDGDQNAAADTDDATVRTRESLKNQGFSGVDTVG